MKLYGKLLLPVFIILLCHTIAMAEPVRIETPSGAIGMGWLFGVPGEKADTLQCWIATPRHVVGNQDTGELQPFLFFDEQGNKGQTETPLTPVLSQEDQKSLANKRDLAFAKVQWGKGVRCNSRLGMVDSAYNIVLRNTQEFTLRQMYATSSGQYTVRMSRKVIDADGGTVMDFSSDDPKAQLVFRQGISGSTIIAKTGGKSEPIAMVQQYDGARNTLRALRYDYIRKAFATVREQKSAETEKRDATFEIVVAEYIPDMPGDFGPGALAQGNTCWKGKADSAKKTAELVIAVNENRKIAAISAVQSGDCMGNPVTFWVDHRTKGSMDWHSLGTGKAAGKDGKACRINLQGPREFRLRFDVRNGPFAISGIQVR